MDNLQQWEKSQAILRFLTFASDALDSIVDTERCRMGATRFRDALHRSTIKDFEARTFPVLETTSLLDNAPLSSEFQKIATLLPWVPSPRSDDGGQDMALAILNDVLDLGDVVVGLLYLRGRCAYPEHQHPPQELYLTIGGTGEWRFGGADDYSPVTPGNCIYNHPMDMHGVRSNTDEPVVALYCLWPDSAASIL